MVAGRGTAKATCGSGPTGAGSIATPGSDSFVSPRRMVSATTWCVRSPRTGSGNLWFGTFREGAAKWDGTHLTRYTTDDGLISNFVLTAFEDDDGNMWFGTFDGVSKFDGRAFVSFDTADGLPDEVVRSVYQDATGELWFGTNLGGVSVYDGRRFQSFTESDSLAHDRVSAIVEASRGGMWIGSAGGVRRLESGHFVEHRSASGITDVLALIEDGRNHLWVAEYGRGIHRCPSRRAKCSKRANRSHHRTGSSMNQWCRSASTNSAVCG